MIELLDQTNVIGFLRGCKATTNVGALAMGRYPTGVRSSRWILVR
jgi:hypothetical protein